MSIVVPFSKLTQEQKEIVEYGSSRSENIFVEGPPGSGKTLVSLHIVKSMQDKGVQNPLVLLFNHSLRGYLRSAFEELHITDATVSTKDKFFWDLGRSYGIYPSGGNYNAKYREILSGLARTNLRLNFSVIILDEIQDFRAGEWALLRQMSDRFIFLGDFEQKLYEDADLSKGAITNISKPYQLTKVYRFGESIADLVEQFSTRGTSLKKAVVRKDTVFPMLEDCGSRNNEFKEIAEIIKVRRDDGKRIGVLLPSRERLEELHHFLDSRGIRHFFTNKNRDFQQYNFSENIPVLITTNSAKGLEFSTVIVAGFSQYDSVVESIRSRGLLKEQLYVALSRATDYLYIMRTADSIPELKNLSVQADGDDDDWLNNF